MQHRDGNYTERIRHEYPGQTQDGREIQNPLKVVSQQAGEGDAGSGRETTQQNGSKGSDHNERVDCAKIVSAHRPAFRAVSTAVREKIYAG